MIRKLDMRKAAGCDGIPVRAVKLFGSHIADPIATIINSSLKEGVVPIQWKSAVVRPIEKKKGCVSLDNYRPISVLPVMSKIMERVVYNHRMSHLLNSNLISECQSGFRPRHSTQDVLLYITDQWKKAIDNSLYTGAVFLDLREAFYCANHQFQLISLHIKD